MRTIRTTLLLVIFLSLFLSCTQDDKFKRDGAKSTVDGITFSIDAMGVGVAAPASKAGAVEESSSLAYYDERYEIGSLLKPTHSSGPSSTTVSSNLKYSGDQNYTVTIAGNNYKYESILWEKGDRISIGMFAPDGTSSNRNIDFVDYQINAITNSEQKSSATITGVFNKGVRWFFDGANPTTLVSPYDRLLWEDAPQGAVFYAFWPDMSKNSRTPNRMTSMPTINSSQVMMSDLVMPATQYCTLDGSVTGKQLYRPDMNLAYMSAVDIAYNAGDNVKLTYYPDFTAFEFIIKNETSSKMRIKSVRLESINDYLAGTFRQAFSLINTGDENTKGISNAINCNESSAGKTITMKFKNGDAIQDYVELTDTPLQFTIMSCSKTDSKMKALTNGGIIERSDSYISGCAVFFDMQISTDGGTTWSDVTRQLDLRRNTSGATNASDWIKIPVRSKVVISNVAVPEQVGSFTAKEFSVSSTKTVVFSPGNLQAKPTGYGTVSEWRFAPHQWDAIGIKNSIYPEGFDYNSTSGTNGFSAENTHWMDLFCYSASGGSPQTSWGVVTAQGSVVAETEYGGDFLDWGNNPDIVSTLGAGWFTPSADEWEYILTGRDGAASKWAIAKVGNVAGLILLPNDWTLPRNCNFIAGATDYTTNVYSNRGVIGNSGSWSAMEKAGAVFLPGVGRRGTANQQIYKTPQYISSTYTKSTATGGVISLSYRLLSCGDNEPAAPTLGGNALRNIGLSVRLVKDPVSYNFYLQQPDDITLNYSSNGGSSTTPKTSFYSYKTPVGSTTKIPVDVTAEFSLDGTTFYSASDAGIPSELSQILGTTPFTATNNGVNYTGTISLNAGSNLQNEHAIILRERDPGDGTSSSPQDLSMYPVSAVTAPFAGSRRSGPVTANSYVIGRAGWYMFPCVYGNAIDSEKNTSSSYNNSRAYNPSGTNSKAFLTPFIGHTGDGIISPFINQYTPINLSTEGFIDSYEAVIAWQDVPSDEQFLTLGGSSGLMSATLQENGSIPYICFNIERSKIQEGNVVIALREKSSKTIVWSWHIWVTARDLTPVQVNMYPQESNTTSNLLMPVPIGYCEAGFLERSFYVRLTQKEGSTQKKIFKISQLAKNLGNAPYYQWGRKDPLLPSNGDIPTNNKNKECSSPAGYTIVKSQKAINATYEDIDILDLAVEWIQYPYMMKSGSSSYPLTAKRNNLWHATNTQESPTTGAVPVKTIYDPCPPGFSVPRMDFSTGFTKTGQMKRGNPYTSDWDGINLITSKGENGWDGKGYWFKKNASDVDGFFVPALENRFYPNTGTTTEMGGLGGEESGPRAYYWCCVPSSFSAGYSFFTTKLKEYSGNPFFSVCPKFTGYSVQYGLNIIPAVN